MSETTASVLVAVVGALGSVLTTVAVVLVQRVLAYLESKAKVLQDEALLAKKEATWRRAEDVVRASVAATQQTLVDALKAKAADGKLTREEAAQALGQAADGAIAILRQEGFDVGRDALDLLAEAAVHGLKNGHANGQAAAPGAA
jgi:hypothetical protein